MITCATSEKNQRKEESIQTIEADSSIKFHVYSLNQRGDMKPIMGTEMSENKTFGKEK